MPLVLAGGRPWSLQKLSLIEHPLERVYKDIPFRLRVVTGSERPQLKLPIPWEWVPYDRQKEAEHAAGAVAGLAPLEDTLLNSCKGNYKVKTYMALGVPPVASAIGYNYHLIDHGRTGFIASTDEEWEYALRTLLTQPDDARKIGERARQHIVQHYSYEALMPVYAQTLEAAFPDKTLRNSANSANGDQT
jgi:glycosyltransferase involved in cell wall biosynthesis